MRSGKHESSQPKTSTENQLLIVGTFFDTTWRMFVPILITTLIGYGIDKAAGSRPVGVIVGVVVGVGLSIWLVVLQYKTVKKGRK